MNGSVDGAGRALVRIQLKNPSKASEAELDAWIDTGFTGELVLPQQIVSSLGLPLGPSIMARLADGSDIQLDTHTCFLKWFDEWRRIESWPTKVTTHYSAWDCSWIAICTLTIGPEC